MSREGRQEDVKNRMSEETKSLIEIIIGAVLFAAGKILSTWGWNSDHPSHKHCSLFDPGWKDCADRGQKSGKRPDI